MKEVRIGLLGLGTVGAGVAKLLESERAMLEERAGCRLRLAAVADLDVTRPREGLDITRLPMTTDANRVLGDGQVDIVVELVGGLEPARSFILKALGSGKHVVDAVGLSQGTGQLIRKETSAQPVVQERVRRERG